LANDTLNAFLNSSLNVELVFIILTSITTFSDNGLSGLKAVFKMDVDNQKTSAQAPTSSRGQYNSVRLDQPDDEKLLTELKKAAKLERHCTLSHIQIKNVDRWCTAGQAKDFV
jgi:hypothetical protein